MKKILLISMFAVFVMTVEAHKPPHHHSHHAYSHHAFGSASFYADGPYYLLIKVDNTPFNRQPSDYVEVNQLRPGRHLIQIKAIGHHEVKYLTQEVFVRPGENIDFAVFSHGFYSPLTCAVVTERLNQRYPTRRPVYHEQRPEYGRW
ncbi:MAG: hypothetical protein OEY56_02280 [Cyclobacteriaceae bacterium]|nr:hypothetical protein [Cyclobacteriaceae bacterium]